jgi:hypothetical protein
VSPARFVTSLSMQLREYRSRWLPLVMVALLPLLFWGAIYFSLPADAEPIDEGLLSTYLAGLGPLVEDDIHEQDTWPIDTALMGVGWGMAAAALFSVIGSGTRDRRLVLAGYRAWEILVSRFLLLLLIALPVSVIPVIIVAGFTSFTPPNLGLVWLGSYLAGVAGAGLGLVVGSLLPRQLEGTILLLGIVGTEISIPVTVTLRHYLPLYGPQSLFLQGRFSTDPEVGMHLLRGVAWALALSAVAIALWTWRTRVHQPASLDADVRLLELDEPGDV